jgi:hypothetical protein
LARCKGALNKCLLPDISLEKAQLGALKKAFLKVGKLGGIYIVYFMK